MSNTFITPDVIAASALATLYNTIVLAGLVFRDYDADFNGHVGDTITVRVPTTFTANEYARNVGIVVQNATESGIPVTLDTILDVSFAVTSEDMALEVSDFETQLVRPAMEAIAQDVDARLAEALIVQAQTAHASSPITGAYVGDGTTTPNKAWRDARAILGRNKLPFASRYVVLSPEAVSDALGDELLVRADQSGSTDGLRDASLGRKFGFETYESQVFGSGAGERGEADGVAFHRDAVSLVSRTLEVPMGVGAGQASASGYKGLGLRVVKQYDLDQKQDVVSIDTLIGVQDLRTDAAVELDFGQGS